jgi:hypothetical protein
MDRLIIIRLAYGGCHVFSGVVGLGIFKYLGEEHERLEGQRCWRQAPHMGIGCVHSRATKALAAENEPKRWLC